MTHESFQLKAWIPSQAKFLNDFNKSFFHIRQMCHRFVLHLAHGVKGLAEAEIISARHKNAAPPVERCRIKKSHV